MDQDPDFLEASRLAFKGWRSITNFLFVNVDRSRGGTIDEITMLRIGESGATSSASNLAWMYSQGLDGNELDAGRISDSERTLKEVFRWHQQIANDWNFGKWDPTY